MTPASRRKALPAGSSASVTGLSALARAPPSSSATDKAAPAGDPVIAAQRAERLEQQRLDMIDAALSALQAALPGADAGLPSRTRHNRDASVTGGVASPGSASSSSPRTRGLGTGADAGGGSLRESSHASAAPTSPEASIVGRAGRAARPASADAGSVRSAATGISGLASVMTSASAAARRLTRRDIHEAACAAKAQLLRANAQRSALPAEEPSEDASLRAVLAPPEEIQRLLSQLRDQGADVALHEILEPSADTGRADLDRLAASIAADGAMGASDRPASLASVADPALLLRPAAKIPRGAVKLRWTPAMGAVEEADSVLDA